MTSRDDVPADALTTLCPLCNKPYGTDSCHHVHYVEGDRVLMNRAEWVRIVGEFWELRRHADTHERDTHPPVSGDIEDALRILLARARRIADANISTVSLGAFEAFHSELGEAVRWMDEVLARSRDDEPARPKPPRPVKRLVGPFTPPRSSAEGDVR